MKNPFSLRLHLAALATAGWLSLAAPAPAQTVPPSPVGTWDFSIAGKELGLALVTFNDDFTLTGVQYMRPGPVRNTSSKPDPRFPAGPPTRLGELPASAPSTVPSTNFTGSTLMEGLWAYDEFGKVIGLLDQVTSSIQLVTKNVTNSVTTTNIVGGLPMVTTTDVVSTTNVFEVVRSTNSVSFRASVVPNRKLTMNVYLPQGHNTYTGLPYIALPDISGNYVATGKRGGVPYVEFLTLSPNGQIPGDYVVTGAGAGYGFTGFAFPSRRNQIAIFMQSDREPHTITVHTGAFNSITRRASLIGKDSAGLGYTYRLARQ